MAEEGDWLPWYRRKDYTGNLTGDEKRKLDSLRASEKHPAARYSDLPEEVQSYIARLSTELYNEKQVASVGRAVVLTAFSILLMALIYIGYYIFYPITSYFGSVCLIIYAWVTRNRESAGLRNEFWPRGGGAPLSAIDEQLRFEWETEYIYKIRGLNDDDGDDDDRY